MVPELVRLIPYVDTGSSSETLPSSTSWRITVAANGFVSDARWYTVVSAAGRLVARSALPNPLTQTTPDPFAMRAVSAGMCDDVLSRSTLSSNSASDVAGGAAGCSPQLAPDATTNASPTSAEALRDVRAMRVRLRMSNRGRGPAAAGSPGCPMGYE